MRLQAARALAASATAYGNSVGGSYLGGGLGGGVLGGGFHYDDEMQATSRDTGARTAGASSYDDDVQHLPPTKPHWSPRTPPPVGRAPRRTTAPPPEADDVQHSHYDEDVQYLRRSGPAPTWRQGF
jgi:hypothetical protein